MRPLRPSVASWLTVAVVTVSLLAFATPAHADTILAATGPSDGLVCNLDWDSSSGPRNAWTTTGYVNVYCYFDTAYWSDADFETMQQLWFAAPYLVNGVGNGLASWRSGDGTGAGPLTVHTHSNPNGYTGTLPEGAVKIEFVHGASTCTTCTWTDDPGGSGSLSIEKDYDYPATTKNGGNGQGYSNLFADGGDHSWPAYRFGDAVPPPPVSNCQMLAFVDPVTGDVFTQEAMQHTYAAGETLSVRINSAGNLADAVTLTFIAPWLPNSEAVNIASGGLPYLWSHTMTLPGELDSLEIDCVSDALPPDSVPVKWIIGGTVPPPTSHDLGSCWSDLEPGSSSIDFPWAGTWTLPFNGVTLLQSFGGAVGCTLEWTFVPSEGFFGDQFGQLQAASAGTIIDGSTAVIESLRDTPGAFQTAAGSGDCHGAPISFDVQGETYEFSPIDACTEPASTYATILRTLLSAGLAIGGGFALVSLLLRVWGGPQINNDSTDGNGQGQMVL